MLQHYKTRDQVFSNGGENDEDYGKKKKSKSRISHEAHLGHQELKDLE